MAKRVHVFGVAAALVSAATFSTAAHAFIGNRNIVGMDIGDSGQLIMKLDGPAVCHGNNIVTVPATEGYYKDMLAMALSAFHANRPINVWVNCGSSGYGRIVRMLVGSIW